MKMSRLAKIVRISLFMFATNLVCAKNLTISEVRIHIEEIKESSKLASSKIIDTMSYNSPLDLVNNPCFRHYATVMNKTEQKLIEYIRYNHTTHPNVPNGRYVAYFIKIGKAEYDKCIAKLKNETEKERKRQAEQAKRELEQARQAKIQQEQQEKIQNDFIKKMEKEGKVVAYFGDNSENRLIYKEYYENDEKIRELFDKESGTELKSKERFYPSGLLKCKEKYSDGKINEKYIYDSNGKLVKKYEYNFNGKLLEKYYDSNGKLVEGYEYDSDGKLSKKYFYLDGDIVHEVIYE